MTASHKSTRSKLRSIRAKQIQARTEALGIADSAMSAVGRQNNFKKLAILDIQDAIRRDGAVDWFEARATAQRYYRFWKDDARRTSDGDYE